MSKTIQHIGIIERIDPPSVFVRIMQPPACSACEMQSACSGAESRGKTIEAEDHSGNYALNEEVLLTGRSAAGMQAVLLACLIPTLLVTVVLAVGVEMTGNELTGAGLGLLSLAPYYGLLYLLRNRLKRKFIFTLSKRNNV